MSSSAKSNKSSYSDDEKRVATVLESVKVLRQVTDLYLEVVTSVTSTLLAATVDHNPDDLMSGVRKILKDRDTAHAPDKPSQNKSDKATASLWEAAPESNEFREVGPEKLKGFPVQMLFDFMKSIGAKEIHVVNANKS